MSRVKSEKEVEAVEKWRLLRRLWRDPSSSAAFSSMTGLYRAARQSTLHVTMREVKRFLESEPSYNRFAPRRRRFKRRQIVSFSTDAIWQGDLAILEKFAHWNKGNRYLLVIVDTLSGFCWLSPVKRKTAALVSAAFEEILARAKPRKPRMLFTDGGLEFHSSVFYQVLQSHSIHLYGTFNTEIKASHCERKIRDVKRRIFRMIDASNSRTYINRLQELEQGLNTAYNRVLKMSALEASRPENENVIFNRRYANGQKRKTKPSYSVNDIVRISIPFTSFSRGFKPTFSTELYRITERKNTFPNVYKLCVVKTDTHVDLTQPLAKGFYSPQIQRVLQPSDASKNQ